MGTKGRWALELEHNMVLKEEFIVQLKRDVQSLKVDNFFITNSLIANNYLKERRNEKIVSQACME